MKWRWYLELGSEDTFKECLKVVVCCEGEGPNSGIEEEARVVVVCFNKEKGELNPLRRCKFGK